MLSNRDQYLFHRTRGSVNSSRKAAPFLRVHLMIRRVNNKQSKERRTVNNGGMYLNYYSNNLLHYLSMLHQIFLSFYILLVLKVMY